MVFNNDAVDGSFGVTQPIVLDELDPTTMLRSAQLTVPNSLQPGVTPTCDHMVTSFSSKSEIALNLSTDDNYVTFMGYTAPVGAIDVSNSNTPGVVDPTNSRHRPVLPDRGPARPKRQPAVYRDQRVQRQQRSGRDLERRNRTISPPAMPATEPTPNRKVSSKVPARRFPASSQPESAQSPGPRPPWATSIFLQLPAITKADKSAKDNNYRGLAVNNNVIYFTKGSGSNGVNTVYYLDTVGQPAPAPASGFRLPAPPCHQHDSFISPTFNTSNAALNLTTSNPGLTPTNMCVLNGFPTVPAKGATDASDTRSAYGLLTRPRSMWPTRARVTTPTRRPPIPTPRRQPQLRPVCRSGCTALQRVMEPGLHTPKWPEAWTALLRAELPDRQQLLHHFVGTTTGPWAPQRRPAQSHRKGQCRRHCHHLGHHLDRELQRRRRGRPQLAGIHQRQPGRHDVPLTESFFDSNAARQRTGGPGCVVHTWHGVLLRPQLRRHTRGTVDTSASARRTSHRRRCILSTDPAAKGRSPRAPSYPTGR